MQAWLASQPVDKKGKPLPRREESYRGNLPEAGPLGYLLEYLHEVGPAMVAGGAVQPVTWEEIRSWQFLTGTGLELYESQLIRMLSCAYVEQYQRAVRPECPPPWIDREAADKKAVSERVKAVFRGSKSKSSERPE